MMRGKILQLVGQESDSRWFRFDGEIKNFKQKENIRVQYQKKKKKNNFTINVKGTALGWKHKRSKKLQKQTQNIKEHDNRKMHIDNYLKCNLNASIKRNGLTG